MNYNLREVVIANEELIHQIKRYMQQDHVVLVDRELGLTANNPSYLMRRAIATMERQEYEYQNLLEENRDLKWQTQNPEK